MNLEWPQRAAKVIFEFRNCLIENKLYNNSYELRPTPRDKQHQTSLAHPLL